MTVMKSLVCAIALALGLAIAGCGGSTEPASPGDIHVHVFNDSPYTLTNVRVDVSDDEHFTIASLAHGDMSADQLVHAMHEIPAVTATANGQTFVSSNIEGFAGFNPTLVPGLYIVTIHVGGTPLTMGVT